jgi:hypothetical protein
MDYLLLKQMVAVLATVGLYSVLFKENKFYRFWEHVFLGLASGWALVVLWTDTLKPNWWDKMLGSAAADGNTAAMGYWMFAFILPIGFMAYTVFSKKHNWLSRIPIGIILGLYSGQQFSAWMTLYGPLLKASMKPVFPNTAVYFHPKAVEPGIVYGSDAVTNAIALLTVLCVLTYFLFSFDVKGKILKATATSGRWLLMIGFGAIFGSTVMMRFTLLIDRMYFIWIEFVKQGLLHIK